MGPGWVGLYVKCALRGESFTISRNWPSLRGALPPPPGRLQMSEPQKHVVNSQEAPAFCAEAGGGN